MESLRRKLICDRVLAADYEDYKLCIKATKYFESNGGKKKIWDNKVVYAA